MNDQAARLFAGQTGVCAVLVDVLIDKGIISQSEFFDRLRRAHVAAGGSATALALADIVEDLEPVSEAADAMALSGQTVLVVEEEPALARDLQVALENAGAEAMVARNAAEALSRIAQFDFSAAVMDGRLDRREQHALMRWLREDGVRLLFHATRPPEDAIAACSEPMLFKPAPANEIVRALAQLAAGAESDIAAA